MQSQRRMQKTTSWLTNSANSSANSYKNQHLRQLSWTRLHNWIPWATSKPPWYSRRVHTYIWRRVKTIRFHSLERKQFCIVPQARVLQAISTVVHRWNKPKAFKLQPWFSCVRWNRKLHLFKSGELWLSVYNEETGYPITFIQFQLYGRIFVPQDKVVNLEEQHLFGWSVVPTT